MPKHFVMIGLPGSGKSAYAKRIAVELSAVVICPDTIREENPSWNDAEVFEYARHEAVEQIISGSSVVFDATNTIRRWRLSIIHLSDLTPFPAIGVWMDTPKEVCLARHLARQAQGIRPNLGPEVIDRMDRQLRASIPDHSEGFTSIFRITPYYADQCILPHGAILARTPPMIP